MGKRGGAIHVATTRRHYKGRVYEAHLLRRSYREDGKVKNETLGNISHLPGHLIEIIRRSLKGETFLGAADAFERTLAGRHLAAGGLVLFDLSSSYLTGTHCPLAARGYSRDGRRGTLQI